MEIKLHNLKIRSDYFSSVRNGFKTFEVRKNDRDFKVGDILNLRAWGYVEGYDFEEYTGNHVIAKITYILDDEEYLQPGYVVLGIKVYE